MGRYFRASDRICGAKVTLFQELRRAPGNLFLTYQFQNWSNFVLLIGQKNIFLANQRGRLLIRSGFFH